MRSEDFQRIMDIKIGKQAWDALHEHHLADSKRTMESMWCRPAAATWQAQDLRIRG
jgi:hypothetical protein